MILEMGSWNMRGIIDQEALTVGFHSMAGQTECGSFGPSHFSGYAEEAAKDGQTKQGDKRKDFAAFGRCDHRTGHKNGNECDTEEDKTDDQNCSVRH